MEARACPEGSTLTPEASGSVPTSLRDVRHGFGQVDTSAKWAAPPERCLSMSSATNTLSMKTVRRLSNARRVSVAGLVLTSAAMLLQIAAGSTLYPSVTGPIVLVATALVVAFVPGRWTAYVGLVVPLVLGVGAIVAAAMTGDFIDQLTNPGNAGIFLGSLAHVAGLTAAVAGGVAMVMDRRPQGRRER
jgi:hypothetical protein